MAPGRHPRRPLARTDGADDLSVSRDFDDCPLIRPSTDPRLTTVRQPVQPWARASPRSSRLALADRAAAHAPRAHTPARSLRGLDRARRVDVRPAARPARPGRRPAARARRPTTARSAPPYRFCAVAPPPSRCRGRSAPSQGARASSTSTRSSGRLAQVRDRVVASRPPSAARPSRSAAEEPRSAARRPVDLERRGVPARPATGVDVVPRHARARVLAVGAGQAALVAREHHRRARVGEQQRRRPPRRARGCRRPCAAARCRATRACSTGGASPTTARSSRSRASCRPSTAVAARDRRPASRRTAARCPGRPATSTPAA